jgi:hypothetical protein
LCGLINWFVPEEPVRREDINFQCGYGIRLEGDYEAGTEDTATDHLDAAGEYRIDTIDADGAEDVAAECEIGSTRQSYSGPAGTEGVGVCRPQVEKCRETEEGARWQIIQEEVLPQTETCNNLDDNCDGTTDEGLTVTSYSGPPGTEDVGICRSEIRVCESGAFVITQEEVLPSDELYDCLDNNCDGRVDNDISLANADFIVEGIDPADHIGRDSGFMYDVNGDGFDDFLIGSPENNGSFGKDGAFLFYGRDSYFGAYNIDDADALFKSDSWGSRVGGRICPIGDFNGDGYSDILLDASGERKIYLVYGSSEIEGRYNLGDADVIFDRNWEGNIFNIASCPQGSVNVNGDGFSDLLISAPSRIRSFGEEHPGWIYGGNVYLIYGTSGFSGYFNINEIGIPLLDEAGYTSNILVSAEGDVNNDGQNDILITHLDYYFGTPTNAYMKYGGELSGTDLFTDHDALFVGSGPWETGKGINQGDINGDGYSDILFPGGYLYWGRSDFSGEFPLSSADVIFINNDTGVMPKFSADLNSDGYDDLLLSSWGYDHDKGRVSITYSTPGFLATHDLNSENISFIGEKEGDDAGEEISTGDFNGDTIPDILISAPFYSRPGAPPGYVGPGSLVGRVYLIYGRECPSLP